MPGSGGNGASKTFKAASAKEVLSLISRELGPDAVITAHGRSPGPDGEVWAEASASQANGQSPERAAPRLFLPTLGLVVLLAGGAVALRFLNGKRTGLAVPAKLTAAVISFEDHTGDGDHAPLAKVIPNLLITRLEQSGFFDVVPWESMQNLLERQGAADQGASSADRLFKLCRRSKIDVLVMGSYAKAGGTFAADVKVLDVKSRKVRASASSKGEGEESVLRSQIDDLGREILRGFGFFDAGKEDPPVRIADITTGSMDAYYHYLRGRQSYSNENLQDARVFLEKAVLLDPQFAMAHFFLASSLSISGERRASLERLEKALGLLDRVTEKERLFIRGMAVLMRPGDYEQGARIFQEMIRLYPSDKDGHYGLGILSIYQRKYEAAVEELRKALELDPFDGKTLGLIGMAYWNMQDYENAIEHYRRQIDASPGNGLARIHMAAVYLQMGRLDEAVEKCEEAFEADPDVRITATVPYIYALTEDHGKALRLMDRVVEVEKYSYFEKGVLDLLAGRRRQAEADVRRLQEYAAAARSRQSEANALWVAGWIACERGDFGRAAASFEGWLGIYARDILPKRENAAAVERHWRAWLAFYLGLMDAKRGETAAAGARLAEIEGALPDILPDFHDWIATCRNFLEAEIALAEGDARRAVAAAGRTPLVTGRNERRNDWLRSAPFQRDVLARACRMSGDLDRAAAEYEKLISNNRRGEEYHLVHPIYHFRLAELYEQKGLIPDAVRHYERFLDLWKDADADIAEIGEARRRLARLGGATR